MRTFRRVAALPVGAVLLPAAALVATGSLAGAAATPTAGLSQRPYDFSKIIAQYQ